jgi:hypothetical protein
MVSLTVGREAFHYGTDSPTSCCLQLLYRVRWADGTYSLEDKGDVPHDLITAWARSRRRDMLVGRAEDDGHAKEPPEEDVDMDENELAAYDAAVRPGSTRACKERTGTAFQHHTGGALWAFCPCGFPIATMELPQAESTRMVVLFLMRIYDGAAPSHSLTQTMKACPHAVAFACSGAQTLECALSAVRSVHSQCP